MTFTCVKKWGQRIDKWSGKITKLENYGSHFEMKIESRSGIMVLFGKTSHGNFACMPDFNAGCHLSDLEDVFYNTNKLTAVMNPVDGITVANALLTVAAVIKNDIEICN
jgi:hypothetical protein